MNSISEDRQGRAKHFVLAMIGLFFAAVVLLWGWNTVAVELFAQQAMRFKHALALELLILAIAALVAFAWRLFARRKSLEAQ